MAHFVPRAVATFWEYGPTWLSVGYLSCWKLCETIVDLLGFLFHCSLHAQHLNNMLRTSPSFDNFVSSHESPVLGRDNLRS